MPADLGRRASPIRRNAPTQLPHWLRLVLEVPLEMKLLGANLIIVVVAGLLVFGPVQLQPPRLTDTYIVVSALILGATVNLILVRLALGPIESLERVAKWVSEGRLAERVPASIVADHELARLMRNINEMLDTLAAGRERVERLGAEVIYAEERQRSKVAQELHNSVGQKLADASFEIAASTNEMKSESRAARLSRARTLVRAALEEIRNISASSHMHASTDNDLARPLGTSGVTPRQLHNNARSTVETAFGLVPDRRAAALHLNIGNVPTPSASLRQT